MPFGFCKALLSAIGRRNVYIGTSVLLFGGLLFTGADRRPGPASRGSARSNHHRADAGELLRVATFNIHSGIGRDGRFDLDRIAASLVGCDLIALNEVRSGPLPGGRNQAALLGMKLKLGAVFAPSEVQWWHGHFGNALLFGLPSVQWCSVPLVGTRGKSYRSMLFANISWQDKTVHVLATHVDREGDRQRQLNTVIEEFLALPLPALLMGDLNSTEGDPQLAGLLHGSAENRVVYPADAAGDHIDWIIARGLQVVSAGVRDTGASDHPCHWAVLRLPTPEATVHVGPDQE